MIALHWIAALALAAVARAGPSNRTFAGDSGDWRPLPPQDPVHTQALEGPGCAANTVARQLAPGQKVQLYFTGTEILLYGIPPPPDVTVTYDLDTADLPPIPHPHGEPPPVTGSCRLLRRRTGLTDELHNLTVSVGHPAPRAGAGEVWLFIANATSVSSIEVESSSNTSIEIPTAPASETTQTPTAQTQSPEAAASSAEPSSTAKPAKNNVALIAGATFGILGLFLVGGLALYFFIRRRRQRTPPSAEFRARMARTEFVMVTGEQSGSSVTHDA